MSHEKLSELCSIYALGALDGEELREFEAHLETGCPLCGQQIREYGETVAAIPEALANVRPSADLKDRLMARLDKEGLSRGVADFKPVAKPMPSGTGNKRGWIGWACAVAAGLALTVSLTRVSNLNRGLTEQQEKLNQQLQQLKTLQR